MSTSTTFCYVGNKRKATAVQGSGQDNEYGELNGDDNVASSVEREIEREVAEIKSGKHPSLLQSVEALERAKQKKIDASDRHRKMQIRNINAHYEYEVEDASALFNVSPIV